MDEHIKNMETLIGACLAEDSKLRIEDAFVLLALSVRDLAQ